MPIRRNLLRLWTVLQGIGGQEISGEIEPDLRITVPLLNALPAEIRDNDATIAGPQVSGALVVSITNTVAGWYWPTFSGFRVDNAADNTRVEYRFFNPGAPAAWRVKEVYRADGGVTHGPMTPPMPVYLEATAVFEIVLLQATVLGQDVRGQISVLRLYQELG